MPGPVSPFWQNHKSHMVQIWVGAGVLASGPSAVENPSEDFRKVTFPV